MMHGRALPGNRWDLLDGVVADPPSVSVVVSHYEQPAQLARTLAALGAQDHPPDRLEIVVADDGSSAAPTVPEGVVLVRQEDRGFRLAAVRNLGAAHASGDVLVFLDADTAPEPSFVRELARLPALAPDCVAIGRRRHAALSDAPPGADLARAAAGRELPEPAWLAEGYRRSRDLRDADDRSYRFAIGAVVACAREMFAETGGFDESFTRYGGEDWEWAYRAWIRGAVLAHVPTAVAWHDGPDAGARSRPAAERQEETLRLADLVPVPGSRPLGHRPSRADIVVTGPGAATPGQAFVSRDSVLAAVPGAEPAGDGADVRFDRVRIRIDLLRPVRSRGSVVADAVQQVVRSGLGSLTLVDDDGVPPLRVVSCRAEARARRWGRDDLFPHETAHAAELEDVPETVDVEAYLGGWETPGA
ncbi:glycosyltransferase [Microbacterium gilvum]